MNFCLAAFPAEVLGLMLGNDLYSHLAVELWKTGDSLIIEKLSSSLTYVHLRNTGSEVSRLPRMLTSLRALRHLRLYTQGSPLVDSPHDWKPIISSLPKTLQRLDIYSSDAYDAVLNLAPLSDRSSDPAYISTDYKRGSSRYIDLGTLFPRLETLKLDGYRDTFDPEYGSDVDPDVLAAEVQDLAGLPDTITRLGLPEILIGGNKSGGLKLAPLLPPSLRVLDTAVFVDYHGMSEEEISKDWDLPHLERIRSLQWLSDTPPGGVSWLPRTLKRCLFNNVADYGLKLGLARTLPPALEDIFVDRLDEDSFAQCKGSWISELPKRLLSFSASGPINSKISDLPRTLRSLSLEGFTMLDVEGLKAEMESARNTLSTLSVWPASLTTLRASLPGLGKDLLSLLPKTLTLLSVRVQDIDAQLDGESLPPGLKDLSISIDSNLSITSPLPSSLTMLHTHCYGDSAHPENEFGVSVESLAMLPASLESLGITFAFPKLKKRKSSGSKDGNDGETDTEYFEIDASLTFKLPPNLEALQVNEYHSDWLSALPRSVRYLNVDALHGTLDLPAETAPSFFATLPPALESLNLNGEVHNLEMNFSTVPKAIGRLPSSALRSLPQTLTLVQMPLQTYDESDAPFLLSSKVQKTLSLPYDAEEVVLGMMD